VAASPMLALAVRAVLGSAAQSDMTMVSGLASALASHVKRAVQLIGAAATLDAGPLAAANAGACFPAAIQHIARSSVAQAAQIIHEAFADDSVATSSAGVSSSSSSSCCSSSQAAASAALLVVVLARNLLQLADAMEAAGPQVYLRSLLGRPAFNIRWLRRLRAERSGPVYAVKRCGPCGSEQQHTAEVQWQAWQLCVLEVMQPLLAAMRSLGMAPSPVVAAGSAAAAASASASSSSSAAASADSSSSSHHTKWGHLLCLQQSSQQWAAAVAAYDASHPYPEAAVEGALPSSAAAAEQLAQQYAEALALCRTLAAAAPVTVVCNNPSCSNLAGVSEAASACKACAGCRCRYCSVDCQRADWKRHKRACRLLVAAGMTCA
jgi:hypothetical protein